VTARPASTSTALTPARRAWLEAALVASLGVLHSLPMVWTALWPLQLLTAGLFFWRLAWATPRRAALLGLVFGTAWQAAGTWWLYISMHRYGGLPAWMAVAAVLLLSSFLSLYLAAAMAAFARWRCGRPLADALLLSALWLLAEVARALLFTGFPWVASGYAHVDGPLAALAPWVGVYGIGAVAAALAAWPALAAARTPRAAAVPLAWVAAELLALHLVGAVPFSAPTGTLSVTLLQGNVAQDEKFSYEHMPKALAWTRAELLAARGDLVVGPETVVPLLPSQLDPDYLGPVFDHFRQPGGRVALIGIPLGDEAVGYTNSVVGVSAATAAEPGGFYRYDKHHLVPFGEFIPTGFRWFTELMNIPLGDFNRGPLDAPSFVARGERVAPNICYEDLFGEELAGRFIDAAQAPTIFANVSNIGWFGDSIAIDQHRHISRMRSLEFQRPMLRATNTGATVVIDHHGAVTASLPPHTQGVLDAQVQGRSGLTPFAWWAARAGLWPLVALALLTVALRARRRGP
jgi:apolipoprotein N-acyltransferase